MEPFKDAFRVVGNNNCRLYNTDDIFTLTEEYIAVPEGRVCCLILVREMTQLLFQFLSDREAGKEADFEKKYTCSGCSGLIKFIRTSIDDIAEEISASPVLTNEEQELFDKIIDYPLIKEIPVNHLKEFISCFSVAPLKKGNLLIEKGQSITDLFILMSGSLIVEDDGVPIATLVTGDLCGEMSYFGNNTACTSVRTAEDSEILTISGDDFGKIIKISDAVHNYMVRLLAGRLTKANAIRVSEFDLSMQGSVNEMTPVELMQVFHMHQKTGVLSLDLPRGSGEVSFLDGSIVAADYDGKTGQDAIFAILAEKEGIYSFTNKLPSNMMKESAIGDFMKLLMEGTRRTDEQ